MSTFELLASHAAALEAAGGAPGHALQIAEDLGLYQAARAHAEFARLCGGSAQAIAGARRRVEHRWTDILDDLRAYEWGMSVTPVTSPALADVLDEAPSIMAAVQLQAPRRDEVGPAYDPDYIVPFPDAPEAPEEKKPEPKPTPGHAVLTLQDCIDAAMAQLHDLPARVSEWPDPAGLFADVKPAPAGYHLIAMDDHTVIVNDAGDVVADDSEVPF